MGEGHRNVKSGHPHIIFELSQLVERGDRHTASWGERVVMNRQGSIAGRGGVKGVKCFMLILGQMQYLPSCRNWQLIMQYIDTIEQMFIVPRCRNVRHGGAKRK